MFFKYTSDDMLYNYDVSLYIYICTS